MGGPEIALAAAVAPELIGGAAGTAAGLSAAGIGAGTAAGLGGTAASMFLPEAGAAALAPSTIGLLGGSGAAPAAAAGMGGTTAGLFGAAGAGASPLATELAMAPGVVGAPGFNWMKAGETVLNGASKGLGQPQQPAPQLKPNTMGQGQQLQSNQEILQRLKMQQMMGPRSNFASLLGGY